MTWVAIYAAVVATLTFGWRIYEWLNDRPNIKLAVKFSYQVRGPVVDDKRWISLTAMNKGRRATTLSTAGFRTNEKYENTDKALDFQYVQHMWTGDLPKRLEEGESHTVLVDEQNLREQLHSLGTDARIKFAWFNDQADRLYKKRLPKAVKHALHDMN